MEIVVILSLLLVIVLPSVILLVGIKKEKKKRIEERNEMFYEGEVKFGEDENGSPLVLPDGLDAEEELAKILTSEIEKSTKPKKKKPRNQRILLGLNSTYLNVTVKQKSLSK